jgi:HEPN domain-containing protein
MKFLTGEWLKSAESDIETIDEIIDNPHLTHVVAFHSHQCIEKCFKAVLEEFEIEIDKIHNLLKLYKEIRQALNIELDYNKLELLSKLYIDARYPSELGLFSRYHVLRGNAFWTLRVFILFRRLQVIKNG